jgi:hypothetical protein
MAESKNERARRIVREALERRVPPGPLPPQPPVTQDDIRRAEELSEKYGLQHLRNKL